MLKLADLGASHALLAKLEKESSRDDLWDNPDQAQELMQEMSSVREQIAQAESLQGMLGDIDAAADLAAVEVRHEAKHHGAPEPWGS